MSTIETIRDYISQEILHDHSDTGLSNEDHLIETGIIDSLGIMTLLAFLEERFSVQIPGDDLIPENFDSVLAISALIERHKTDSGE